MSIFQKFNPFAKPVKKKLTIDAIHDSYYYRITNRTPEPIKLEIKVDASTQTTQITIPGKPQKDDDPSNVRVLSGRTLNAMGEKTIQKHIFQEEISFQPLEIEVNTTYRISNRTARRIGIGNYDDKKDDLIIPPFGTRLVNSELLRWYKFLEWQRQDLINLVRDEDASKGPGSLSAMWDWIKLLPGIMLVILIGFGIPLWVVYHFGGGDLVTDVLSIERNLLSQEPPISSLMALGRLFQVGFICVASILPALFYYLFGRQQVEKLRQKFFHDILVLDPHIYTLSEAESKYDTLLSSAYGSSRSSSPFAILLLMFSTALLVAGWILTIVPYGSAPVDPDSLVDFFSIEPSVLTLGFLGTYFFSINMIFRRYVRADLTPKTYAYITVRLLVTFVLIWVINALPEFSNASQVMQNGLFPLAFLIGIFPEDGFRVIRDSVQKSFGRRFGGSEEKYPLTALDGMNQYDQARLLEEGIENIENLAHHNLIELLAFTRIPTARLVDMLDQAILYIHLGNANQTATDDSQSGNQAGSQNEISTSGMDMELLQFLKSFGVRTATDLIEILKSDKLLTATIPDEARINRLRTIRVTFSDDEWLAYVMNWRKESSKEAVIRASFINDPYRFYGTGTTESNRSTEVTAMKRVDNIAAAALTTGTMESATGSGGNGT